MREFLFKIPVSIGALVLALVLRGTDAWWWWLLAWFAFFALLDVTLRLHARAFGDAPRNEAA